MIILQQILNLIYLFFIISYYLSLGCCIFGMIYGFIEANRYNKATNKLKLYQIIKCNQSYTIIYNYLCEYINSICYYSLVFGLISGVIGFIIPPLIVIICIFKIIHCVL